MRIAAALLLLLAAQAGAATVAEVSARPQSARVLEAIERNRARTADFLVEIGGIVSPSGKEQARAAAVAARMKAIGLKDVTMDGQPNVVGRIPGRSGKALLFVSTLDDLATVAELQRAAGRPPRIEGGRVVGPGTNTSSTTAAMLAAAEALVVAGVKPEHDLVFAAVAQEETGLKGMRALYAAWRDRLVGVVDILGDSRTISYGALGIRWWRVTAKGPPGHTLMGGLPNVNQGIGRAVDRILSLPDPARHAASNTRLNVAVLSSGQVFNHKPESGWFSVDERSLDASVIEGMDAHVAAILAQVTKETGIAFERTLESDTPGGQIPGARQSPLVRWAAAVAASSNGTAPELRDTGSANLNIAIAGGTPAIGIGGERGGRRGFADEWADTGVMDRMARQVALIALTVGNGLAPPEGGTPR